MVWGPIRTCAYALVYTICTCAVLVEMVTLTSHIWSIITQVRMVPTIRTCGKMEESSDVTVSIFTKTAQVHMVYTSAYAQVRIGSRTLIIVHFASFSPNDFIIVIFFTLFTQ